MPEKAQSPRRRTDAGSPLPYHRSDCFIFRRQDGQGHEESPPLGGYIVEGKYFLAEHAPLKSSHVGTVIVEARRHLLDFGEMTSEESVELGGILKRLVPAVKFATGAERVYFLALMERAPHFHLWLVPKKSGHVPLGWPTWPNALPPRRAGPQKRPRRRFERGTSGPESRRTLASVADRAGTSSTSKGSDPKALARMRAALPLNSRSNLGRMQPG
jgi:diadenosine tetraphosphate (Ap4A) HIT family hydrolase